MMTGWKDNYSKIKKLKDEHSKYAGMMTVAERQRSIDGISEAIEANYGYLSMAMAQDLLDKADALKRAWSLRDAAIKAEASSWNGQEYLTAGMAVSMKLKAVTAARSDNAVYGKATKADMLEKAVTEAVSAGKYAKRALLEEIDTLQNTGAISGDTINSKTKKMLADAKAELDAIRYTPLIQEADAKIEQRRQEFIKTFDDVRATEKDLTGFDALDPMYQIGEVALTFKRIKFDGEGRPAILPRDDEAVTGVYFVVKDGSVGS